MELRSESTYTTICFRPRSELRMNLRVRSVTGCSRSAMFASCVIQLVEVLDITDSNAATYRESATGYFNGRMKSSWSCVFCVCGRLASC